MTDAIIVNEAFIRGGFFVGVLVLMMSWEVVAPRRLRALPRFRRWTSNLGIVVVNTALLRLIFPTAAVATALAMEARGGGLLGSLALPYPLAVLLGILILDLVVYAQHVAFHAVPALWRLHRMHHADLDFDVTTGIRFHPIEILLSMVLKIAIVAILGPPALAVLIFEVLLNATSLFNHGNVWMPLGFDRVLRWIVVTPDMHRVHHSIEPEETNSNFGFNLPWWDRLFGTYRAQPAAGHGAMTIGLDQFRDPRELWIHRLLIQPFRGATGIYPMLRGRRRR